MTTPKGDPIAYEVLAGKTADDFCTSCPLRVPPLTISATVPYDSSQRNRSLPVSTAGTLKIAGALVVALEELHFNPDSAVQTQPPSERRTFRCEEVWFRRCIDREKYWLEREDCQKTVGKIKRKAINIISWFPRSLLPL